MKQTFTETAMQTLEPEDIEYFRILTKAVIKKRQTNNSNLIKDLNGELKKLKITTWDYTNFRAYINGNTIKPTSKTTPRIIAATKFFEKYFDDKEITEMKDDAYDSLFLNNLSMNAIGIRLEPVEVALLHAGITTHKELATIAKAAIKEHLSSKAQNAFDEYTK